MTKRYRQPVWPLTGSGHGRREIWQLPLVLAVTLISATCYVAIVSAFPYAPPLRFAALRLLIGGGALLVLLPILRQPLLPPRKSWPWLLPLVLFGSSFAYGTMFVSPRLASAGVTSVLGNTQPLLTLLLAALFLHERLTRSKWIALLLGFGGVILIASPALSSTSSVGLLGGLLALTSAAALTASSLIVKSLGDKVNPLTLAAWQLLLGSLPLFAASALLEPTATVRWTPAFTALLLFLALVGTALVTALWYWLIQGDEVGHLSLFFFTVPVFGLGLSVLFFDERLNAVQLGGLALIIAGLLALYQGEARPVADHAATPKM